MKKNKILLFIFTFALAVSIMGCTTRQMRPYRTQTRIGMERPNNTVRRNNTLDPDTRTNITGRNTIVDPNTRNDVTRRDITPTPNIRTDITGMDTAVDSTLMTRANTIAQRVADLNDVDRASVVITGNTALVGVDMRNNIQGRMTTELKRKIEAKVKNTDSRIKNVAVTADPDLSTRINRIVTDMENGRPISGFANEIQEMLRKITPIK